MSSSNKSITVTVTVAALGYFVDIYDLLLFGIVRIPSLRSIGVPEQDLLTVGIRLINSQMLGLLIGGVLWGVWADKKGRLSVLFSSILLYSVANIANAFVSEPTSYALLRFVAGIGLAGELGAAITLVSELMPKETRGLGTTVIASVGILGAVLASVIGDLFDWRVAYAVGGCMGLALLFLRMRMFESGMYQNIEKASHIRKGDFLMLFTSKQRFFKYVNCILIGVPIWFVIGILITFSPELAKELEVTGAVSASTAIMTSYIGLSLGDLSSGLLSQFLKSRRKVVALFLVMTAAGVMGYASARGIPPSTFYALCIYLGFSVGYWAVFVTVGAEQFGTNLRGTVATTVPNFVRGSVVPVTLLFQFLSKGQGWSLVSSALTVGALTFVLAAVALWRMRETFSRDLNYLEETI